MKTLLSLLLVLAASALLADSPRVLFRVEFAPDGAVRDVSGSIVGKDAEGFSTSTPMRASTLPQQQQAQFGALQGALIAAANAGGWRLVGGEIAQTGATSDFRTVANPRAKEEGEPATLAEAVPGTARPVLTLWMTQTRDGKTRYQTITSEQWPPDVRGAVLGLWRWLEAQA